MVQIAFIGLGTMGSGMVANLLGAGHNVRVFNRERTKTALAVERGAEAADSIADVVGGADFVMYCLADDAAVEAVVFGAGGVLENASAESTVIDLSTISPEVAIREHEAFHARDVAFIDAPVFGSRGEAAEGGLWVVVGGVEDVYRRSLVVLEPIAETTHYMGPGGSGTRMKLVGNLLVASQLTALGEALTLAKKAGLDLQRVLDVVNVTDFKTPIYAGVGPRVLRDDYAPDFKLALLLKDLGLISALGEATDVPLTGVATTTDLAREGVDRGYGDENASAVVKVIAERAGVDLAG